MQWTFCNLICTLCVCCHCCTLSVTSPFQYSHIYIWRKPLYTHSLALSNEAFNYKLFVALYMDLADQTSRCRIVCASRLNCCWRHLNAGKCACIHIELDILWLCCTVSPFLWYINGENEYHREFARIMVPPKVLNLCVVERQNSRFISSYHAYIYIYTRCDTLMLLPANAVTHDLLQLMCYYDGA